MIVSLGGVSLLFIVIIKHSNLSLDLEIDPGMIGKEEKTGGRVGCVSKEISIVVVHDIMRSFHTVGIMNECIEVRHLLGIEEGLCIAIMMNTHVVTIYIR